MVSSALNASVTIRWPQLQTKLLTTSTICLRGFERPEVSGVEDVYVAAGQPVHDVSPGASTKWCMAGTEPGISTSPSAWGVDGSTDFSFSASSATLGEAVRAGADLFGPAEPIADAGGRFGVTEVSGHDGGPLLSLVDCGLGRR